MNTENRRSSERQRPPQPLPSREGLRHAPSPHRGRGRGRGGFATKKIRVLLAKAGLDGHDRGIKVIAMALRDAGMEVVYLGLRRTPEEIVSAALEEDVDVIGISLLSGAHTVLFPAILALMRKKRMRDTLFIGGGIIPDEDQVSLRKKGVAAIYTPGANTTEIVQFVKEKVGKEANTVFAAKRSKGRKK